jgi:hypothetical protein
MCQRQVEVPSINMGTRLGAEGKVMTSTWSQWIGDGQFRAQFQMLATAKRMAAHQERTKGRWRGDYNNMRLHQEKKDVDIVFNAS